MNLNKWIRPLPVLAALCCLLVVSNVLVWRAKKGFQRSGASLKEQVLKLEADGQASALREKSLQDQKKELELKVTELTQKIAGMNAQLESANAASQKFTADLNIKENEIKRLNDEVARGNAEAGKYKEERDEAAGNLERVHAAYEELKKKLWDLSSQKKISDKNAKKLLKELAEDDQPASLGTAVVKG